MANNHKAERMGEDGQLHIVTLRDSQDAPKKMQTAGAEVVKAEMRAGAAKAVKRTREVTRPLDFSCQTPPSKKRLTDARYRAARTEADKAALKRNLDDRISSLTQSTAEPASWRMAQVQRRVRLRIGSEPSAGQ